MKLIFTTFVCPQCGLERHLKTGNICVDCKDKQILETISQSRKREILIENLA